jgi:hypothetical protein
MEKKKIKIRLNRNSIQNMQPREIVMQPVKVRFSEINWEECPEINWGDCLNETI